MYIVTMKIKKEGFTNTEQIKLKVKDEDMKQFVNVTTVSFGIGEADRKILKMK